MLPTCRIYLTGGNIKTGEKTMDALLKLRDLMEIMKISRSTLWRVQQREDFPKPMTLMGCKRWRREELQAWLDQQAVLRDNI
jgi:predicted DNA-binding transcriptional regulator AlpA